MSKEMNIDQIKKHLHHRYPFLLVDRVIELDPGKSCVAIKNLTVNESYFNGHFQNFPLLPGVLIIESMAQVSGLIYLNSDEPQAQDQAVLTGVDNAKFKKQARPGDQLVIHSKLEKAKSFLKIFSCEAYIKDHNNNTQLACTATVRLAHTKL